MANQQDDSTIVLDDSETSSSGFTAATLNSLSSGYAYAYTNTASVTIPNGGYTLSSPGIYNSTYAYQPSVNITSDGIVMPQGSDIKVGGKSLTEAIEKIEERLGILKPNPELEDRWEQLKDLRKQYQELEKELLEKEKMWKILKEK